MTWLNDFRAPLTELLKKPLPDDPRECIEEMQKRLEEARLHESTVARMFSIRDLAVRDGQYRLTREMIYAAMAYQLLKAKLHWEDTAMKLAALQPAPIIVQTLNPKGD